MTYRSYVRGEATVYGANIRLVESHLGLGMFVVEQDHVAHVHVFHNGAYRASAPTFPDGLRLLADIIEHSAYERSLQPTKPDQRS